VTAFFIYLKIIKSGNFDILIDCCEITNNIEQETAVIQCCRPLYFFQANRVTVSHCNTALENRNSVWL